MKCALQIQRTHNDVCKLLLFSNNRQVKQSGAAEVSWAHNPEVNGWKPSSVILLNFPEGVIPRDQ